MTTERKAATTALLPKLAEMLRYILANVSLPEGVYETTAGLLREYNRASAPVAASDERENNDGSL